MTIFEAYQAKAGYWYVDKRDSEGGETVAGGPDAPLSKQVAVSIANVLNVQLQGRIEQGSHVLVVGSPIAGFQFFGPFADEEAAEAAGESHFESQEWWVAPLDTIEEN